MKRVLITGADSYIGVSFERYAARHFAAQLSTDTVDMRDDSWRRKDFSLYDIVYHVAGIAHADTGRTDEAAKKKYYAINTDLAIETCQKAKKEGVRQFIFMSSAIIYGDCASYGKRKRITRSTLPQPSGFYGDSKWQADQGVRESGSSSFTVTVVRPPMIYGKGSKGNYPVLAGLARKLPVFPDVDNERSVLYIENLCEFLSQVMIRGRGGVFWPQNREYVSTGDMVKIIAKASGHKIAVSQSWNWAAALEARVPGKVSVLASKAFGSFSYDHEMSCYDFDYQTVTFEESVRRTEGSFVR